MDEEFMKQFSGSASANLLTVAVLGVLAIVKKCTDREYHHSKCTSCCLSVELDKSSDDEDDLERGPPQEAKTNMHELYGQYDYGVRPQYLAPVPPRKARFRRSPGQRRVAKRQEFVQEIRLPEIVSPASAERSRRKGQRYVQEREERGLDYSYEPDSRGVREATRQTYKNTPRAKAVAHKRLRLLKNRRREVEEGVQDSDSEYEDNERSVQSAAIRSVKIIQ